MSDRPTQTQELIERIKSLMERDKVSDYDIESRTGGAMSPSTVYRIRTGKTKNPELNTLETILNALGDLTFSSFSIRENQSSYGVNPQIRYLPIVDLVKAGEWHDVADPYEVGQGMDVEPVINGHFGENAFALKIVGDSMLPDYRPGDIIIVDPSQQPSPGDFVIAKLDGEQSATFKKYRPRGRDINGQDIIELAPLNADWPTLIIDAAHPGTIVGRVMEHHRKNL